MRQAPHARSPEPPDELVAALVAVLASLEQPQPAYERANWRHSLAPRPAWSEIDDAAWRDAERRRGWRL
jgi:hypothetical protein